MISKINPTLAELAVPISQLKEDPSNARKHNDRNIGGIAASLQEHGQQKCVIALKNGTIIAGNGTLRAAISLGWDKLAVTFFDSKDSAKAKAYAIADNRTAELATWDLDILSESLKDLKIEIPNFDFSTIGFNEAQIQKIIGRDLNLAEDDIPEVEKTDINAGDVFTLGAHRLMCGDSTDVAQVEKLMAGEKAGMVFTDPPYNVDYVGKTKDSLKIKNDKMSDWDFRKFLNDAFKAMLSHCAPGAAFYVCHADSEGYNFRGALADSGFALKQCIIWVKNSLVMGRQDYHWRHEPILYGWNPAGPHKWYGDKTQDTVWEIPRPSSSSVHPTMKPVELCEKAIFNSSSKNAIVLDLFGGSGSTLIACEKTNRKCRMMELDPIYCQVIIDRWEKFSGKKVEKF